MVFAGVVVKLDRKYPLVRIEDGREIRCEHAKAIVKGERVRAVIGDRVSIELPEGHDKGIICGIEPRRTRFIRKDPAERTSSQVLAANFDTVIIVEPIIQLNWKRLERELVLAHETGARVALVLTKADLSDNPDRTRERAAELAASSVPVLTTSLSDEHSIAKVRELIPVGETAILIGKSGVGKSSLVNALMGCAVQTTASVRERDGKGRHTTVDRVMISLPNAGAVVDTPGIRGLGVWDADQGLSHAFADIEHLANSCRFRDCAHKDEPGCAVREAIDAGGLAQARFESYQTLAAEIESVKERRIEARRLRGEKASTRRKR